MKGNCPTGGRFPRRQDPSTREIIDDFIERDSITQAEFREAITFLIRRRESLRDSRLAQFKIRLNKLLRKMRKIETEQMLDTSGIFPQLATLGEPTALHTLHITGFACKQGAFSPDMS